MDKNRRELEFMTGADDILDILRHSKDHGNVIGISSPFLGNGIFITAVDDVIENYETVVLLKPIDVNGGTLAKNILRLSEITSACSFRSRFDKVINQAKEVALEAPAF
jgi:hypothetical protein